MEQRDGKIYVRLPDRAEDMTILEPTIDDINITVVPVGPSEAQVITSNVIQLPPIPSELVRLRSEIAGIDEAIERLKSGNHPALAQAQQAIQTAQAQVDSLARKKSETWEPYRQAGGNVSKLESWVAQNPKGSALNAKNLCPPSLDPFIFISLVIWGQQWALACLELSRVQKKYEQKRAECIEELTRRKRQQPFQAETKLKESAITAILEVLPGYDSISANIPGRELTQLLPELKKYEMEWDSWGLIDMAERLWKEKRPVVMRERERMRKAEEEERKRKAKEAERKRRAEEAKWQYREILGKILITGLNDKTCINLAIPARINSKIVTEIGDRAFYGCSSLASITIPESVKKIGKNAFTNCPYHMQSWQAVLMGVFLGAILGAGIGTGITAISVAISEAIVGVICGATAGVTWISLAFALTIIGAIIGGVIGGTLSGGLEQQK